MILRSSLALICFALVGCTTATAPPASPTPAPTSTSTPAPTPVASPAGAEMKTGASGLKYQDLVVGTGSRPRFNQNVRISYVGTLENGMKFDSGTIDLKLGTGEVIKGWEIGIGGGSGIEPMRVGGRRKLIIPPELGYGAEPMGTIPPNSTLIFEVELIRVG